MKFPVCVIFICFAMAGYAQNVRDIFVDESSNGKVFLQFLTDLEKEYQVDFIVDEAEMRALTVMGITHKQRLTEYLDIYASALRVVRIDERTFFIIDKKLADEYGWSKESYIVLKDRKLSLKGTIIDGKNDDPLPGAQVYFPTLKQGALSDENGRFHYNGTAPDILPVEIKYVGYDTKTFIIGFSNFGTESYDASTTLYPVSKELQSVTVTAERIDENVLTPLSGIEKLGIAAIKSLPTFLGEVDPIRSLTTLPGVSTAGEIASGFNVRGGESGQNLILQDGATIYNPSHLFGFFSAFNPDIVSGLTLNKGGGPANFGGRISSILDISLKNGNAGKHTVTGGVGLISSRLAIEGPIKRNMSSYIIGGRISYCNWLVNATDNIKLKNSSAKFNDITGRFFQTIGEKDFLTFSIYNSYDAFSLATDSVFSWGTFNLSLKWDHTFNDKMFSAFNVTHSNYYSEVESFNEIERFVYRNSIRNIGFKYDLTYSLTEESKILAGIESQTSLLEPGKLTPHETAHNIEAQDMNDQHSLESAVYAQGDFKLSEKWSLSAGLRYSHFLRLGKDDIYQYDYNNMSGRYPSIRDTIHYASGSVINNYGGFEPRISARYLLPNNASIKGSFYRGYQYMHLISNTLSTTPQDFWVSSGPYLKPQIGYQFALGYFRNLKENLYEVSAEGFYKEITNAVDYIEGADITLNPALEAGLSQGRGLAYGLEVFLKKTRGRFNGWVSYTYSRSLRRFNPETGSSITINDGKYYPSAFDQPNIVSVVLNYRAGLRGFFSANFNYSTGRPITIPVSKFSYDVFLSVLNYSQRNEYRIPDYHRLDLSFTIKEAPNNKKRYKGEWVFSVFNVYSRKNTYSISFDRFGKAQKLSVLGSVFPSITYNFSF
jgi:hypothetical protein